MKLSTILVIVAASYVTTGCFMGPMVSPIGNNTYMASGGSMYGNNSYAYNTCANQGRQ